MKQKTYEAQSNRQTDRQADRYGGVDRHTDGWQAHNTATDKLAKIKNKTDRKGRKRRINRRKKENIKF